MQNTLPATSTCLAVSAVLGMACVSHSAPDPPVPNPAETLSLEAYRDSIPGTLVEFTMIPVPGGSVTVETPRGPQATHVAAFWIGKTEVTWDEYDVFAFRLDLSRAERAVGADAVSRPSRPYGAPDRGFGHAGYPALSMTYAAAVAYCEWLSAKTGTTYRLATDAEWTRAAQAGRPSRQALSSEDLAAQAWYRGNSNAKTHPVATKRPNGLGLYDLFGNAAEWVTGWDRTPVTRGGSYRDPPERVGPHARAVQTPAWNMTDPQMPKSRWWLSDASFVGFRIVREP